MSAGINLIVLMTIIPYLTRLFVHRWRQRQSQADKNVTLICGIALVAGSLAIFLAPSPALLVLGQASVAFGIAMTTTARSFITSMVPPRYLTVLSSTVASVTYAGIIAGGPLLAAAFQWGLQAAPFWSGLPFLATAAMFAAATVGVLVARGGHSDLLDR
jgi:MFS family permease